MPFTTDNNSVGSLPFLTMSVDATGANDFTQADIDNNLTACIISGNNEVGQGSIGNKLFGKVIAVSEELQTGTTIPAWCIVQTRGIARFKYASPIPIINQMAEAHGTGRIRLASADADIAAGGHLMRGQVINVITASTEADVWLG